MHGAVPHGAQCSLELRHAPSSGRGQESRPSDRCAVVHPRKCSMTERHPLAFCEQCPLNAPSNTYVPSDGPDKAALVVVGEAPGFRESVEGKPFVGASGKLLNVVLESEGIERADVVFTNVCLCRPPENATPPKAALTARS